MDRMVGIVRFKNKNGVKFRGVPVEGGYRIQRRYFLVWCDQKVAQATSENIGCGLRRVSIDRVPLLYSQADFMRLIDDGTMIVEANASVRGGAAVPYPARSVGGKVEP